MRRMLGRLAAAATVEVRMTNDTRARALPVKCRMNETSVGGDVCRVSQLCYGRRDVLLHCRVPPWRTRNRNVFESINWRNQSAGLAFRVRQGGTLHLNSPPAAAPPLHTAP